MVKIANSDLFDLMKSGIRAIHSNPSFDRSLMHPRGSFAIKQKKSYCAVFEKMAPQVAKTPKQWYNMGQTNF
jgi:hypothetical protein